MLRAWNLATPNATIELDSSGKLQRREPLSRAAVRRKRKLAQMS